MKPAAIALSLVIFGAPQPKQSGRDVAAELFDEAHHAIETAQIPPSALGGADTPIFTRASLLIEIAKGEATPFPDRAAADAIAAFRQIKNVAGRARDVETMVTDPATAQSALGWGARTVIEPEAIRILMFVKHDAEALELARSANVDRSDVYDPIVRAVPLERIVPLIDECRAGGGSYPYAAIGERARTISDARLRLQLLRKAYGAVGAETSFKQRSSALMLILRTHDLVPVATATKALTDLLDSMAARPAHAATARQSDRDAFGPEILQLMTDLDPDRAAALAAQHPDWERDRKIPGRTSANPIGTRGGGRWLQPAIAPAPPPIRPTRTFAPMSAADFERAIADARASASLSDQVQRLVGLGYLSATGSGPRPQP